MRTANSILATALAAVVARIDGVFDDPALVAFGPLSPSLENDVAAITQKALTEADTADAITVRLRELVSHYRLPRVREAYPEGMKAMALAALESNRKAMSASSPWKPIATAPKDRPVLVACYGGASTEASYISDDAYRGWYATGQEPSFHDGPGESQPLNPDLWQELPVAPAKPA